MLSRTTKDKKPKKYPKYRYTFAKNKILHSILQGKEKPRSETARPLIARYHLACVQ